jgi:hypothetical protein
VAGVENLSEDTFVVSISDISVDQEFTSGQIPAEFACYNSDLAGFDDCVGYDGAFPPQGTIEVAASSNEFFLDTHFAVLGPLPRSSLFLADVEDKWTFVPQHQTVAGLYVDTINDPDEGKATDSDCNQQ